MGMHGMSVKAVCVRTLCAGGSHRTAVALKTTNHHHQQQNKQTDETHKLISLMTIPFYRKENHLVKDLVLLLFQHGDVSGKSIGLQVTTVARGVRVRCPQS